MLSTVQFGRRKWTLTEQQKDGRLHYFIFDHFLFRWMPDKWRTFLRWGLKNPYLQSEKSVGVKLQNSVADDIFAH